MRLNILNRDMFKPFRSHLTVWSVEFSILRLRIYTGFKGVSFRETHLREHFGRTDKIALITCLKKLNVSAAFLSHSSDQHPKNVNSGNLNYCPFFCPGMFALPKANSQGVEFLFLQCLTSSRRQNFRFSVFFVFCGQKLLRARLKAPALTGYVRDAQY